MRRCLNILSALFMTGVFAQEYKNVDLLDNWTDTTITPALEDVRFNDVYGFADNGENYAIIGSSQGAHILAIQNNQLVFVDFVPGSYQHLTVEHRDYARYQNYIYAVCDEGTSSLQVFDISYLPDSVHVVYDSDLLFQTAHSVFIDEASAKLYACGANGTGMKIITLADPLNPVLYLDFMNVNYVHDCYVYNDTAFLNCAAEGLHIYNFGGPVPIQLGVLDFYAGQGYNHSGSVSPSRGRYAFTDEDQGSKIKLCNLGNLAEISVDQQFATDSYLENVPHNVVLLEKLAICSYYNEGLRIFDLAYSPIREIAAYDTYLPDSDFKMNGAWGVFVFEDENLILISDRQTGLYLFYFPIHLFEEGAEETYVTNSPFINENSILITRNFFGTDDLSFSIYAATGQAVYEQQSYKNWANVPLTLTAGVYFYGVYDADKNLLEKGQFVKAN